jgi:hypothetical protein
MKKLLLLAVFLFIAAPVYAALNTADISGGVAVGAGYSEVDAAPTNGMIIQGNVGIGTPSPTYILSLGGGSPQTFWMERGSTAGNNLTVQAGGGLSGGSKENGGNLILSPGVTTGTGTSNTLFNAYPAGSSGTSDDTALTALTLSATWHDRFQCQHHIASECRFWHQPERRYAHSFIRYLHRHRNFQHQFQSLWRGKLWQHTEQCDNSGNDSEYGRCRYWNCFARLRLGHQRRP